MKIYHPTQQRMEFVQGCQNIIITTLRKINRPGMEQVIRHLIEGGFFTVPASVKYHNNFYGGLAYHSAMVMLNSHLMCRNYSSSDSLIICSLLHDVCKMDEYVIGTDGLPHHTPQYYANSQHLHGSKSVALLQEWGLVLSDDEKEAILYHMGEYTRDAPLSYSEVSSHPLVKIIHDADVDASQVKPFDMWDPNSWLCEFEASKAKHDTHTPRIKVWQSTLSYIQHRSYNCDDGDTIHLKLNEHLAEETHFYQTEIPAIHVEKPFDTAVSVIESDCLVAAQQLLEQDSTDNICVLNMASSSNPGGGVTTGAGAQEEYLFRCSDLFRSLYQYKDYCTQYSIARAKESYPLDKHWGGIFSPKVTIIRGCEADGYPLLSHPWQVNIVSAAMQRLPYPMERIPESLVDQTIHTIQTILRIAYTHGQRRLVLSAIGCGAFHNPPKHMAQLFQQVLSGEEFKGAFQQVIFAIIDDHNAHAGNVDAFRQVLENQNK